jgi:excisionase family DNA binding protein
LTVQEVAELLRAKPSTIYAWAEQELIPHCKLNGLLRFSEDDIKAWIKSNHKKPAEEYNNPAGRRPREGGQS